MWTNPPTQFSARQQAEFDRLVEFFLTWGVLTREDAEQRAYRSLMGSDTPVAQPDQPPRRKFYPPPLLRSGAP